VTNTEKATDVAGAATILGVRRRAVYRLAQDGRIPAAKIAGKWRFLPSALAAYLSGDWTPKGA